MLIFARSFIGTIGVLVLGYYYEINTYQAVVTWILWATYLYLAEARND